MYSLNSAKYIILFIIVKTNIDGKCIIYRISQQILLYIAYLMAISNI